MKLLFTLVSLLFISSLYAAKPSLDLLTQSQADAVSKEFSGNFIHTNVSPASSLGDIFGFEVGLVAGLSETPEIDKLSKTFDASATIDKIPHAGAIGSVSVPFGITAEMTYVPEVGSDVKFKHLSYGAKWTFSRFLPVPLDIAIRLHGSSSTLSYTDVINNTSTGNTDVNSTIAYDTSSFGYNLSVSKKLLFVEPYIGLGRVSTDTDIKASASTTVSIFTFSSASSYTSENSGTHLFAGVNLNLFLLKIGAEYSNVMGVDRYSGKLSFYF